MITDLSRSGVVERVPAQGTATTVAAFEPFEETAAVKEILASPAALGRELLISTDDRVADGAFCLSLQCAFHITPESNDTVC